MVGRDINCLIGSLPFTYLSNPIRASMSWAVHWNPIIDKFRSKLSKWKASTLSFIRRLILCKFVLGNLGTFFFSLYKVSSKVIKCLEKIRLTFSGVEIWRKEKWLGSHGIRSLLSKIRASLISGALERKTLLF